MKTNFEYITKHDSPNYDKGRGGNKVKEIVIHHWGEEGQSFNGVVNWLCNPKAGTSAHYVVMSGKVACIVDPENTAWHAGDYNHNQKSIGIECRPEATEGDYETAAELIADLWDTYGKLPLLRHKDIVATACPGKWDIKKLKKMAEKIYGGSDKPSKPATKPSKPAKRKISDVYNPKKALTVKQAIKAGQAISNIILGTEIAEDGISGPATEKNGRKILQWAMNKDYGAGLAVDGIIGTASKKALGYHTVRYGETQHMVTALEVLLLLNGYNPHGVELPGQFGAGCEKATGQFQKDGGLVVDKIAGRNTFLELVR